MTKTETFYRRGHTFARIGMPPEDLRWFLSHLDDRDECNRLCRKYGAPDLQDNEAAHVGIRHVAESMDWNKLDSEDTWYAKDKRFKDE